MHPVQPQAANPSFWVGTTPETDFPRLDGDVTVDVAVLGGGITGITAAHLLKRAGKTVALVEMKRILRGVTGYTTAKLTVGQNLIYTSLVKSFGEDGARLYAESNQAGIEEVARIVSEEGIDGDFERASNYVYVESADEVQSIRDEVDAARKAGIDAHFTTETDLPYPVAGAVRVDDQAQFHPRKYLLPLAEGIPGDGSHVYELTRATHVREGDRCRVETTSGTVFARDVIVATHLPFLDRGFFFAKAHPSRSYAIAASIEADRAPRGMYISSDQPTRSIRSSPDGDGRRVLIVGGEGHKPGEEDDTEQRYRNLEEWTRERFPGASIDYRWSSHDYLPVDGVPYIGKLRRRTDHVFVATGFAKWGLTKGTFGAMILTDAILGRPNPWAELYDAKRLKPLASAKKFIQENGHVGWNFFADRVRKRDGQDEIAGLAPGQGTIVRVRGIQRAVYRDEAGTLHALSTVCTHLGCNVGWNNAERTWDCPCHGSRFSGEGVVVQGPATKDLERKDLPGSST